MNYLYDLSGFVLEKVIRYRQEVIIQNISRAFPAAGYGEVKKYQASYYKYLTRLLWENTVGRQGQLMVHASMQEQLEKTEQQNKPLILMLGHYGNWEALTQLPLHTNVPVQAFYKPVKNRFLNEQLLKRRQKNGLRLLNAGQGLLTLLKEKNNTKNITLFIADQFPGYKNGIETRFLNQHTHFFTGAEKAARVLDACVGYIEIKPAEKNNWELHLKPICEAAAATPEGFVIKTYAKMLEQSILDNPSMWLWSHKRWK